MFWLNTLHQGSVSDSFLLSCKLSVQTVLCHDFVTDCGVAHSLCKSNFIMNNSFDDSTIRYSMVVVHIKSMNNHPKCHFMWQFMLHRATLQIGQNFWVLFLVVQISHFCILLCGKFSEECPSSLCFSKSKGILDLGVWGRT